MKTIAMILLLILSIELFADYNLQKNNMDISSLRDILKVEVWDSLSLSSIVEQRIQISNNKELYEKYRNHFDCSSLVVSGLNRISRKKFVDSLLETCVLEDKSIDSVYLVEEYQSGESTSWVTTIVFFMSNEASFYSFSTPNGISFTSSVKQKCTNPITLSKVFYESWYNDNMSHIEKVINNDIRKVRLQSTLVLSKVTKNKLTSKCIIYPFIWQRRDIEVVLYKQGK